MQEVISKKLFSVKEDIELDVIRVIYNVFLLDHRMSLNANEIYEALKYRIINDSMFEVEINKDQYLIVPKSIFMTEDDLLPQE